MDRQTVYNGELGISADFLQAEQNIMVAIGELIASLCGTATFVTGFSCTPTTPTASLQVVLGAGCIYASAPLEATNWSSLNANTSNNVMKQGIALNAQTVPTLTPPSTSGFSQDFLIEVQYQDSDANSKVLPYFNPAILTTGGASNWAGPGNNGASQSTQRLGILAYQIKAGVAATTGTQTAPTPDSGWTGLYVITLANGQTQITSSSIAVASGAPFLNPPITATTRTPVNGTNYTVLTTDRNVAYTALSAARVITLPTAASYPTGTVLHIFDESGSCSTTDTLTINPNGSDTISGKSSRVIQAAYGFLQLESNGSNKWTVISHDIASWIANLPTTLPATAHTPWNDGGVISTT